MSYPGQTTYRREIAINHQSRMDQHVALIDRDRHWTAVTKTLDKKNMNRLYKINAKRKEIRSQNIRCTHIQSGYTYNWFAQTQYVLSYILFCPMYWEHLAKLN